MAGPDNFTVNQRLQLLDGSITPANEELGASLVCLPFETLSKVIFWLTEGRIDLVNQRKFELQESVDSAPKFTFVPNCIKIGQQAYQDLVSLSSTCKEFRYLLGPVLFHSVSLVRENQVDACLSSPKQMEVWSDGKRYRRELLEDVLQPGFHECWESYRSKERFEAAGNDNNRVYSEYQTTLSLNNFVHYLECENASLKNMELALFPRVKALKVLDIGLQHMESEHGNDKNSKERCLQNLESLAINCKTLIESQVAHLWIGNLKRLDLLCDFSDLTPKSDFPRLQQVFERQPNRLQELNIFVSIPYVLTYQVFLLFLHGVVLQCPELVSINIRTTRRKQTFSDSAGDWETLQNDYNGMKLIDILSDCRQLKSLGFDLHLLEVMDFPLDVLDPQSHNNFCRLFPQPHHTEPVSLTIIEPSMSTPKLVIRSRNIISFLVQVLAIAELRFQYGEVIEQCHLQSLNLVTNFVEFLSIPHGDRNMYLGIGRVSTEMCWSVSDDSLNRDYYHNILLQLQNEDLSPAKQTRLKHKLAMVNSWSRQPYNSPRYRARESFDVHYTQLPLHEYLELSFVPADPEATTTTSSSVQPSVTVPSLKSSSRPDSSYASSAAFWSVEASLVDMEQYGLKKRLASSIWLA